ncbi:MAG: DsbA family oxidoreductase [Alphaproteobacteria bacterium]
MLIEIVSDLVCPWCYVGKHRLDQALASRDDVQAEIRWVPFQLNPEMPEGGMDRERYITEKFGDSSHSAQVYRLAEMAAAKDGLSLNMDHIRVTPNTALAHRAVRYAEDQGVGSAYSDRLFRAYLVDGLDIGDQIVLEDMAEETGLIAGDLRAFLASEEGASAIGKADLQARRMGISAVPTFIFNRHYIVSGAQEAAAFDPIFDLAILEDDGTASPLFADPRG